MGRHRQRWRRKLREAKVTITSEPFVPSDWCSDDSHLLLVPVDGRCPACHKRAFMGFVRGDSFK